MAVPKYDEMYIPLLEGLKDGKERTSHEINNFIVEYMKISDEDLMVLVPSGKTELFKSRASWARTYLKKAGLIKSKKRGVFEISESGRKMLLESPEKINNNHFLENETFRNFQMFKKADEKESLFSESSNDIMDTPQDSLEEAFQKINLELAEELLAEIMNQSPAFFEKTVVKLLEKMGYGGSLKNAGEVIGKSGDEGIDGIIREDKLGFDLIYIQAKRWDVETTIGRPEIQKFVGALAGQGANKGLFITTAKFSREAVDYVKKQHATKIVLVDSQLLTELMIDNNLGVSIESIYEIKKIDSDFFND